MRDYIKNWGWIILLIVLAGVAILLFVNCVVRSAEAQEWWCAGAMFGFAIVSLGVEAILRCKGQRSDIASAFSLLSVIIYALIFLGGACFRFWWDQLPNWVFGILVVGFLFTIGWYVTYLYNWHTETHLGGWDILKGFGGATFAEFASGIGVLVSIGIYLVYTPDESSIKSGFWWAAQLAALISLFSAAVWVQRYVLEKPTYTARTIRDEDKTPWNRFWKTGPNLLNSIVAILTVLAILFPTQENRNVLDTAIADSKWTIFLAWGLMLLAWIVSALLPTFFKRTAASWPTNPPNEVWQHRDDIKRFLSVILILTIVSLGLVIWIGSIIGLDVTWPSELSLWAARIAAGLFVLAIIWKWVVDQYEEEADSELKMLMIFRDIALLVCGSVIFIVQIESEMDPASPLSTLYKFILGMMAYSTLIGILIGAYKWSRKRAPSQRPTLDRRHTV